MSDGVKIGLLIAAAALVATVLYIYFSPYQTCIRTLKGRGFASDDAAMNCYTISN